mgnify:CR=1 FL=1
MRRLQTKTAKRPQRHEIDLTWTFRGVVVFVVLLAVLVTYNQLNTLYWNAQYIKLGKSIDCSTRPNPAYLRCVPSLDGVYCDLEASSPLMEWHGPIDYVCSQYEPQRPFRFPVYQYVEYVEG